jgi:tetratricopeptide (TPR) repeat protein
MKLQGWLILLLMLSSLSGFSQAERKFIRRGNDAYEEKHYTQSEVNYRKALENEQNSFEALFNVGDALYKQEKYEDAARQFNQITSREVADDKKARAYHNLGNSLLKANKLKESISSYKQALRLNPGDVETKHNLTYAMRKLREQQQKQKNQQQNQQQQQNKQNQQNQQKKQQEDQQKQQGQNRPNQQDQQENQQKKQPQGGSPQQQKISKEDAKRLLQALENDEKQLQKKLKKKKAKAVNAKTTKNW